ncbi:hypothetical protein BK711_09890 [Bacillus thuringiensis serovar fukuokaensis]|nr:hypothetical protein BK711_09890 [Bacillus thuringiensis serovar fukuokaensis]
MFTEKMTKTRFTINVNFCDVINFILILFGLGMYVAGISQIIGFYKFNFLLGVICFIFVSLYIACMYLLLYIFTRDKKDKVINSN